MDRSSIARLAKGLNFRLILTLSVIHTALIPLLFGGILYMIKQGFQEQFVNQVRSEAYLFSHLAGKDFTQESLTTLINEATTFAKILFAEIVDDNNNIIYDMSDAPIKVDFKEDFFFGQNGDGVYFISVPLFVSKNATNYHLRLGFNESNTDNQIQLIHQRIIYTAIAYIGLTFALIAFFIPKLNRMRKEIVRQAGVLEYQSIHDALTGLPNRVLFENRMKLGLEENRRQNVHYAVLLIDLNRFKEVNDTLGHAIGDMVLQETGRRLQLVRDTDTLVRLGGDEFALIIANVDEEGATTVAKKLIEAIEKPYFIEHHRLHISASVGIAITPRDGKDTKTIMRHVDMAMYEAKRTNMGYCLYHQSLDKNTLHRLALTSDLKESLLRENFVLYYQPKMCIKSNKLLGAEALIRWRHPNHGLIMPEKFIGVAEDSGLITAMTSWVIKEALRQQSVWQKQGIFISVAVNLSPISLFDAELPHKINKLLHEYHVPPEYLEMEITESAILSDINRATETLTRINNMGISLSIDDFGTGYSSFIHVKKLPISQIKIDRSFIKEMETDNNTSIVNTIIELAHHLNLTVVAEGAEEESTIAILHRLGCDMVQGYYISPPLPAQEMEQFIKTHNLIKKMAAENNIVTLTNIQ